MNPPPAQKPCGFDRGLQFLAGVLAFTVFQRYCIPRDLFRPTFPYVLATFAAFVIAPIVVWSKSLASARPARTWALVATSVWASLLLSLYGSAFLHGLQKGYSQAKSSAINADSDEVPEVRSVRHDDEKEDDLHECWRQLRAIEAAKVNWEIDHPAPKPQESAAISPRKRQKRPSASKPISWKANPSESDLFGPDSYIEVKPRCPKGGTYVLGTLQEKPRCTYPDHSWDYGRVLVVNENNEPIPEATVTATNASYDRSLTTGTNGSPEEGFGSQFYREGLREIFASCAGYEPSSVRPTNWPAKIVLHKKG
jgi:hypothetical protein